MIHRSSFQKAPLQFNYICLYTLLTSIYASPPWVLRSFRRELLDAYLFRSLAHVRQLVGDWMLDYNAPRPHQTLNFMTTLEFKQVA